MRRTWRRLCMILLLFLGICPLGCHAPYLLRQCAGGVNLLARARSVSDALTDVNVPEADRAALKQVRRMLRFAEAHALDVGNAYQTYVDLRGRPPVWVLYACPPDRLRAVTWSFPVVGRFPYKGFFDRNAGERAEEQLVGKGLETMLVPASAYSLLGWIPDPIFSSFLRESPGVRAEVLFHELTHRTLFIRGQVPFNESLANFVGQHLARRFLQEEYGVGSAEAVAYENHLSDRLIFDELMRTTRQRIEKAFEAEDRIERMKGRRQVELWAAAEANRLPFREARYPKLISKGIQLPFLLSITLYHGRPELFQQLLDREGSLASFFDRLRQLELSPDGDVALERWLDIDAKVSVAQ